jgi:type II secretory ATPase GspE/PulE/Tfp pilus assembly ATPase PilB-like protein
METHNLPAMEKHYHGTGCKKCSNTGYSGRIAVYEYIEMSPALKKLVANNASESSLIVTAKSEGVTFLFEDAWNKVKDGITTVEEVIAKVPMD